jgi:hypothetical protein
MASVLEQAIVPGLRPDSAVVMPAESAAAFRATFHKWCSRSGPAMTGHWTPDPETIRDLEGPLAVELERALAQEVKDASRRPAANEYYRQYIGIQIGRRRVVYINGFHERHLELVAGATPASASDWTTRLVNVCDGGSLYFGAEYEPATRRVSNIYFNGRGIVAASPMPPESRADLSQGGALPGETNQLSNSPAGRTSTRWPCPPACPSARRRRAAR